MTTATSTAKKSFFSARIKANLKSGRNMMIITSILQLIGLPLASLLLYISSITENETRHSAVYDITEYLAPVCFFAFFIAILLGVVVVMSNFSYLHKISKSDMNLSLPLTSRQRFSADYISGIIMYIVPAIIAALLALIPLTMTLVREEEDFPEEFWQFVWKFLLIYVVALFMFYNFLTFAAVISGSSRSAYIAAILVNIVIPGLFLSIGQICSLTNTRDIYSSSGAEIMLPYICSTSPIGCVVFAFFSLEENPFTNNTLFYGWFIDALFITLIVLAVTYFLYKIRKAEQVSKPHVYPILHHIITGIGLFCLMSFIISIAAVSVYDYNDYECSTVDITAGLIPSIIIGAIFYILIELISQKSFRHFIRILIRYSCITVFTLAFCEAAVAFNGFGLCEYIPNANQLREISIDGNIGGYYINTNFKDKKVIKELVKANKELIKASKNDFNDNYSLSENTVNEMKANGAAYPDNHTHTDVNVIYYKKNGGFLMQDYWAPEIFYADLLPYIITSDEYAESIRDGYIYTGYGKDRVLNIKVTKSNITFSYRYTQKEDRELIDAYIQDLKNFTPEQFYTSPEICQIEDHPVRECFTNTIEVIERHCNTKLEGSVINASNYGDIDNISLYTDIISNADTASYINGDDKVYVKNEYINLGCDYCIGYSTSIYHLTPYRDELLELLNASSVYYRGDEIGGIITSHGTTYYIPVEYKDTVQMIYDDAKEYIQDNLFISANGQKTFIKDRMNPDKTIEIYDDTLAVFSTFRSDKGWYRLDENKKKVFYDINNYEDEYNSDLILNDDYYDYYDDYNDDYYYNSDTGYGNEFVYYD